MSVIQLSSSLKVTIDSFLTLPCQLEFCELCEVSKTLQTHSKVLKLHLTSLITTTLFLKDVLKQLSYSYLLCLEDVEIYTLWQLFCSYFKSCL